MHLIVCIDERDGMSFCGRRLSRDSVLNERILTLTEEKNLWMSADSASFFPEDRVLVAENFLSCVKHGEYCFVENVVLPACIEDLESVTLFQWNRRYPATTYFSRILIASMHLVHREDFPGNSHEKITMERYEP